MSIYTKNSWTDGVTPVDKAHMDVIENGVFASQFRDEKGVANGYASLDANALVPVAQLPAAVLPGAELAYAQIVANVSVTATSAAAAQTAIAGSSVTYDGTAVIVEFFAAQVSPAATVGATIILNLFDGTTDLGRIGQLATPAAATLSSPVMLRRRLTPTAGAHTYNIRVWVTTGNGFVVAGTGGTDTPLPAYLRITRA